MCSPARVRAYMYAYAYRCRASVEATVQVRPTTTEFVLRE